MGSLVSFWRPGVVLHGVPRLSADVGVTLALTPDVPESFARDMDDAGFDLRVNDPEFVRRTRVMPFVHRLTGIPLDIVLAGSGLEEEFLRRATIVDIGGSAIRVIDVEDLMIARVLAGRPKDIEDAGALWRLHGPTSDADRIRAILQELEDALGQSDVSAAFDGIASGRRRQ